MPKSKLSKTDGLGPLEIKKIRTALRLVWHRSYARQLVVKRCLGSNGFSYCEKCKIMAPALKIDHIEACGDVNEGYIERLFCSSDKLQGLCKACHDLKTKEERKSAKARLKMMAQILDQAFLLKKSPPDILKNRKE